MNMQLSKTPIGLDGVPAAETVLSHVDGERGELIIAGERVGDLVRKTGLEGVTARLWSGATGQPVGEAAVRAALGEARQRAFARRRTCRELPAGCRSSMVFVPPSPESARKTDCSMRPRLSARFR